MNEVYCAYVRRLQAVNLEIRRRAEQAELLIEEAHAVLNQLATAKVIGSQMLLGAVILTRPYSLEAECMSSGQIVQAALSSVNGFGCIFWDSEEFAQLNRYPNVEYEARQRFIPVGDCPPAVKASMLRELEPLLGQLLKMLAVD